MPQIEINGETMEQCDQCGNIWDGYAQCNCWEWWGMGNNALIMNIDAHGEDSGYDTE
jgi:hypothetical protein